MTNAFPVTWSLRRKAIHWLNAKSVISIWRGLASKRIWKRLSIGLSGLLIMVIGMVNIISASSMKMGLEPNGIWKRQKSGTKPPHSRGTI